VHPIVDFKPQVTADEEPVDNVEQDLHGQVVWFGDRHETEQDDDVINNL
jgi:hypothetical protein